MDSQKLRQHHHLWKNTFVSYSCDHAVTRSEAYSNSYDDNDSQHPITNVSKNVKLNVLKLMKKKNGLKPHPSSAETSFCRSVFKLFAGPVLSCKVSWHNYKSNVCRAIFSLWANVNLAQEFSLLPGKEELDRQDIWWPNVIGPHLLAALIVNFFSLFWF